MKKSTLLFLLFVYSVISIAQSLSDVLEKSLGSVVTVGVFNTIVVKTTLGYRGESASEVAYKEALDLSGAKGSGSGFVIKLNGSLYVITNAHVVEEASDEAGSIFVYSINRSKYEVKLIGGDSFYDVAVLAFVDNPGSEITSVQFRDKDIRIGERVYAIGNPLGKYPYTVTDGIISAKNRVRGSLTGKFGFLQTTATLIWGNSGGPLLDSEGKVAGINSQIAFAETPDGEQVLQSQINFALESGISKRIVNDIINNDGRVRRAYVGMEISESYGFEDYAQQTMVLIDKTPVISGVIPGSPALSVGTDILNWHIQKINGIQVRNLEEALGELEKATPRTTITFTLEKNGVTKETSIRSGELKTQELEKIATFVLSQNPDILVDYNHPQVKFRLKSSDKQSYATEKERYRQQMTNNTVAAKNYYILAAGISEDNTKNMWLTENLTKLGVAFRLTGTIGIVDYYVLNADDESLDIEVLRQYLSGDEDIIKSTIWY